MDIRLSRSLPRKKDPPEVFLEGGPTRDLLQTEDSQEVLYRNRSVFYRMTSVFYRKEIVIYRKKNYSIGLLWKEDPQQDTYKQKTLKKSSIEGRSSRDLLLKVDILRVFYKNNMPQQDFYRKKTLSRASIKKTLKNHSSVYRRHLQKQYLKEAYYKSKISNRSSIDTRDTRPSPDLNR